MVREFCGHGIGRKFHEEPQVLHYGRPGTLDELLPGMIFTIEPMINAGRREIRELGDGWTIVTKDRSLSAQWEHTVLVTDTGYEVLTRVGRQPAAAGLRAAAERMSAVAADFSCRASRTGQRSVASLRARFRDGKAALLEHFRESRATALASTRLTKA